MDYNQKLQEKLDQLGADLTFILDKIRYLQTCFDTLEYRVTDLEERVGYGGEFEIDADFDPDGGPSWDD